MNVGKVGKATEVGDTEGEQYEETGLSSGRVGRAVDLGELRRNREEIGGLGDGAYVV